jgi:hypothetical protein
LKKTRVQAKALGMDIRENEDIWDWIWNNDQTLNTLEN